MPFIYWYNLPLKNPSLIKTLITIITTKNQNISFIGKVSLKNTTLTCQTNTFELNWLTQTKMEELKYLKSSPRSTTVPEPISISNTQKREGSQHHCEGCFENKRGDPRLHMHLSFSKSPHQTYHPPTHTLCTFSHTFMTKIEIQGEKDHCFSQPGVFKNRYQLMRGMSNVSKVS